MPDSTNLPYLIKFSGKLALRLFSFVKYITRAGGGGGAAITAILK